MTDQDVLRRLPPVQLLIEASASLCATYGRAATTDALRLTLERLRGQIRAGFVGAVPDQAALLARAGEILAERRLPVLRRVINATGIALHTNLGRARMAPEALAAVAEVASGYTNLEFDLDSGRRGARTAGIEALLRELAGAEAGLAVNNGAAAILLALSALADGGEVIVSRGELVEIGGGFRIPDVIRHGGARLVEVGSTNKTRADDYRAAIGPQTKLLLKVHQSNFRTIGFTEETPIAALADLARAHRLALVADLGSGLLADVACAREPTLAAALRDGADLVTCSGDKLLGGPQAGLICGAASLIDRVRHHPLLRAVRLDKMTLAALEATLRLHRDAPERIPLRAILAQATSTLQARAERLQSLVGDGEVIASLAYAGGGALPEQAIESRALALDPAAGPDALASRLRRHRPAVVGRIADGKLLLDMLTVDDAEIDDLAAAIGAAAIGAAAIGAAAIGAALA